MCIRDRPQLEHPDQSFEGLTADEITADFYGRWTEQTTPPCLYTVHPVSYTHLDVYKRQSLPC